MKHLLLTIAMILLTSCGKVLSLDELLNPNDGLVKESHVNDLNNRLDLIEKRINSLESELSSHEQSFNSLLSQVNSLDTDLDTLEQAVSLNAGKITTINNQLDNYYNQIDNRLDDLEDSITVSEYIDPCGDNVGQFDEILIVMSNGDIIAYFESGHNSYKQGERFLTILSDGHYRTTDNQACNFSVINGVYHE